MATRSIPLFGGILALAQLAAGSSAYAATPNLSGAYTFRGTSFCQAAQNVVKTTSGGTTDTDVTTNVFVVTPGSLREEIGVVTFTPTVAGGQSGAISLAQTAINGSLLITEQNGSAPSGTMTAQTGSKSGTYSIALNTANTTYTSYVITITWPGKSPLALNSVVGEVNTTTGMASHVEALKLDMPVGSINCSESISMQHK